MTLFILCAVVAVAGAVGVVVAKRPVHSVLALVLNFIGLAVLYLGLEAEFMAVIQLIIYAGAIMVLFLFVIALLTARKDPVERSVDRLKGQTAAALALGGGVLALLGAAGYTAMERGSGVEAGFGSVKAFGMELVTTHVMAFELTAFVLMVAVVGVIILVGRKTAQ